MTRPLLRARRVVESRLLRLQQRLNDELGFRDQRLRFTQRPTRVGPIEWELRNEQVQAAGIVFPEGVVADLAPAANDESILYFGYNEQWQPARSQEHIEFVSSNLRFVIGGIEEMPSLHFRLEWAGAKTHGGVVAYPGRGAAHPHWQFHVDEGWIDPPFPAADRAGDDAIEIDLESAIEEIDLSDHNGGVAAALHPTRRISATLAGFHHLHLPARTMWHDLVCDMPEVATPQQHTPESEDQIDRWVISALRYLKSEFTVYM